MTADPLLTEAKMSEFARTFPSISAADGELATTRFLLAFWDLATTWCCGQFNVIEALNVWIPRIVPSSWPGP